MKNVYFVLGAGLLSLWLDAPQLQFCTCARLGYCWQRKHNGRRGRAASFLQPGRSEGDNPTWYQHTDYYVYDLHGKLVRHVNNTVGYYAKKPGQCDLPAGGIW